MFKTSQGTGNKVQERTFTLTGKQYKYLVTARRMQYKTFNGLDWGKITYSAVLVHSNEGVTPASCGRTTLINQLQTIDNSPKGMFN